MITGCRKKTMLRVGAQNCLCWASLPLNISSSDASSYWLQKPGFRARGCFDPDQPIVSLLGWDFRHKACLRNKLSLLESLLQPRMWSSPSTGHTGARRQMVLNRPQQAQLKGVSLGVIGWYDSPFPDNPNVFPGTCKTSILRFSQQVKKQRGVSNFDLEMT